MEFVYRKLRKTSLEWNQWSALVPKADFGRNLFTTDSSYREMHNNYETKQAPASNAFPG
jgi:hypothetical protein